MNPESRFRELLSQLLDGDFSADEREELARLCEENESFREMLRSELEFAELLRHTLPAAAKDFSQSLEPRLSGDVPAFEVLSTRLIDGEATPEEIEEVARHCRREEERAHSLRSELKWADLFEQAATERRSEDAFVESLATRMWAEQEQDEFVDQTTSKIVSLFPDAAQPVPTSARPSKVVAIGTWATAAAAAIAVAAIFLVSRPGDSVAEIVHTSDDVRWKHELRNSSQLEAGLYALESGVVTLAFENGAEMTIEGPAEFDLRGDNAAYVHSGIAVLDQSDLEPEETRPGKAETNHGFTLNSRGIKLVDTYDTIGIDARNAYATEAVTFNGGAEVCLQQTAGSCRDLYKYEAVRVDLRKDKILDIPYNPRNFARSWEVVAGVERNTGSVRIELPGAEMLPAGHGEKEVQVFVERDRFVPEKSIEVDDIETGHFASASGSSKGRPLSEKGELRSYLLQLWPEENSDNAELEASVTFTHEVVGVIYSSARLKETDAMVGTQVADLSNTRGLDGADESDSILLSEDRHTVNLKLQSGNEKDQLDHVRVLVALR